MQIFKSAAAEDLIFHSRTLMALTIMRLISQTVMSWTLLIRMTEIWRNSVTTSILSVHQILNIVFAKESEGWRPHAWSAWYADEAVLSVEKTSKLLPMSVSNHSTAVIKRASFRFSTNPSLPCTPSLLTWTSIQCFTLFAITGSWKFFFVCGEKVLTVWNSGFLKTTIQCAFVFLEAECFTMGLIKGNQTLCLWCLYYKQVLCLM